VLEISRTVRIERPASVVAAQFGDVAHHQRAAPHRGVEFRVLSDGPQACEYEQVTRLGPIRARQRFVLERTDPGHQVNRITEGLFAGGSITFDVDVDVDGPTSEVTATLRHEPRGVQRLAAPVLRRMLGRALAAALAEDKADLESGRYEAASG
jgi:hypothetical protein